MHKLTSRWRNITELSWEKWATRLWKVEPCNDVLFSTGVKAALRFQLCLPEKADSEMVKSSRCTWWLLPVISALSLETKLSPGPLAQSPVSHSHPPEVSGCQPRCKGRLLRQSGEAAERHRAGCCWISIKSGEPGPGDPRWVLFWFTRCPAVLWSVHRGRVEVGLPHLTLGLCFSKPKTCKKVKPVHFLKLNNLKSH